MYYRDFIREMAHPLYAESALFVDRIETALRLSRATTCEVMLGRALKEPNGTKQEDRIKQLLIDYADVSHKDILP